MKKFLLLAHGEMDHGPEYREAHRAWWESIQHAVMDSGNPLVAARDARRDGSVVEVADPALGYSIVEAESMEAAVALLDGCPMDMWVYEAMPM